MPDAHPTKHDLECTIFLQRSFSVSTPRDPPSRANSGPGHPADPRYSVYSNSNLIKQIIELSSCHRHLHAKCRRFLLLDHLHQVTVFVTKIMQQSWQEQNAHRPNQRPQYSRYRRTIKDKTCLDLPYPPILNHILPILRKLPLSTGNPRH